MPRKKKVVRKTIRIGNKPVTMRFSTRAQADTWYAQMKIKKENARAGIEMPVEPKLIEVAAAELLCERQALENFLHDKYRMEAYVLPRFIGRHLHTILRKEWKEHFQDLARDGLTWADFFGDTDVPEKLLKRPFHALSPKTQAHIKTLVSLIYEEAMRNEPPNAVRNPMETIALPESIEREKPHWKTVEDQAAYLAGARDEHTAFWIFAMLALNTGMREGEIIAIKWRDIDFRSQTISVWQTWDTRTRTVKEQTKTKRDRTVVINKRLLPALLMHREQTPFNGPNDHIVYRWKTGNVTDSKTLWEIHDRVIRKAGIKYINVHGLRHTHATWHVAAGRDLYELKTTLGHKTITMTEKYVQLVTPKMREDAALYGIKGGISADVMMTQPKDTGVSYELH
jgi:integrase